MSTIQPRTSEFADANLYNNNPDIAEQKAIEHAVYVEEVTRETGIKAKATSNAAREKEVLDAAETLILKVKQVTMQKCCDLESWTI